MANSILEQDAIEAAEASGVSLEEYLQITNQVLQQAPEKDIILDSIKKTQGPAEQAAIVGPQNVEQPDTDSLLEITSLDLPKPKEQNEIPQIPLDVLGDKDAQEENVALNVREWFNKNGLNNDFDVEEPVNPFAEKIRIKSKQTGEKFDYIISEFSNAYTPLEGTLLKGRTPQKELNDWLYSNSRHDKNNKQDFYKATGISFSNAPDTTSDEDSFDENDYLNNTNAAQKEVNSYIKKLLNTNKYKKYSLNELKDNPSKKQEYIENIYEDLEDNNMLEVGSLPYFNKDGIKNIIQKSFGRYVEEKDSENQIQQNILANTYLENNNIPKEKAQQAYFGISKNTYFSAADENTKGLFALENARKELEKKLAASDNPVEQSFIQNQIDGIIDQKKKIDKDFVSLANPYSGKISLVKKENVDNTNSDVTNISSMVDAYKQVFNAGKPNQNVLEVKASEIGKQIAVNDMLGDEVIPYVKVDLFSMTSEKRFEEFKNIKLRDLKPYIRGQRDILDADGNKINNKVNQYFDQKLDLMAQNAAVGDLLYLNRSTEGQDPGFFKSIADGFVQSVTPENLVDKPTTQREKINLQQQILEESGIELTTGMKKAAIPDLAEDLGTGIGGSVVPIAEFAVINVATAGLGSQVAATRLGAKALNWYNASKNSANIYRKGVHVLGQLGLEETKTQIIGLDKGSGVAFKGFHYIMPLQFRRYMAPGLEKIGVGNRTANVVANVSDIAFGSAVRAGGAMETAAFVEHVIKEGETSDYINENFQDLTQVGRRMLVQGLSMSWLGGKALFNRRTYYGAKQFQSELQAIDVLINKTKDPKKAERYKQAQQAIVSEMVSQNIAKDVANDVTFADLAKGDILQRWPEVKKAIQDNQINFEIKITNNPKQANGSLTPEVIDGRLKLTVNINKAKVVETAKTKDGEVVGVIKNASTIGHEGFHASVAVEAYNSLKAKNPNKKITKEDLDLERSLISQKYANKALKAAENIQSQTGINVKSLKETINAVYSDKNSGQIAEETVAALRDLIYNNMSYKASSILQVKKVVNSVKQALNIKKDVTTANEFLEILDRLSNKKGKEKFDNDKNIDISTEAVSTAKMGIETTRTMDQRGLSEFEKLEAQKLELELKNDSGELDYDIFQQQLENIRFKQDRLSREGKATRIASQPKQDTKLIGDDIKAMVPPGTSKKAFDNEYAADALVKLTETNMLDGVITNMMTRDGIVSDNVFGKTKQEFINEVKGRGKSNTFLKAILKFNPEQNNDFGGWVINSLRGRYKDALVLFKKQQAETQGKDIAEAKEVAFETSEGAFENADLSFSKRGKETEAEVSIYNNPTLKERGLVNENNQAAVDNAVLNGLKKLLGTTYSTEKSKNKRKTDFLTDFMNAIKGNKEFQKLFKKSIPLKTIFEGSNKDAILENLSTFFLGGKTTGDKVLGGMPFAIEKSVNGKFLPYPEWVGKKIDREATSEGQAGRTSGNELVRRASPSSIKSIEPAFAKRGSDLAVYNQLARTSAMQRLTEILGKENPNPKELEIQNLFEKISKDSDVSFEVAEASVREAAIRVMEQRDLPVEQTKKIIGKSKKISERVFGATIQETINVIKDEIPGIEGRIAKQFALAVNKDLKNLYNATIKNELNSIDLKTKKGIELTTKEAELKEKTLQDIKLSVENKAISKQEKIKLVDVEGKLTPEGESFKLQGEEYLKTKGTDAKSLNFFLSTWGTALRYNGESYISNAKLIEMFPSLKGKVQLKPSGKGQTISYKGKLLLDPRTAEGKALSYNKKARNNYNENVNPFKSETLDYISKLPNVLDRLNFSDALFSNLNSTGALVSKIKYAEVINGKPVVAEKAVWEHNTTRNVIKSQIKKWITGVYSREVLEGLSNGWEINLISKETDLLLEQNGFKQKGSNNQRNQFLLNKGISFTPVENINAAGQIINKAGIISQPRVMEQRSLNTEFNNIIERSSGIGARKKLSAVVARRLGNRKNKFKLFLPPAAEDFRGLYYSMLGKGKQGETDKKFFQDNLVLPYTRGISAMEKSKQALLNDYKTLNKTFRQTLKDAGIKKLNKNIPGTEITAEQAMRIYLWSEAGFEIPELTKADQRKAVEYVYKNPAIQAYAESLLAISKQEAWSKPNEYWDTGSVLSDLTDIALNVNRKQYLEKFVENKKEIFSNDNLNKIEASYGRSFRESIEDIMYRMETGTNKSFGKDSTAAKWNTWVTNSVGAIMFFNRRSATLQLLSTANFMNTGDNNPLKAGAAFANQPQYWKDWSMIFNSPKLKERRGGLKSDVQEAEIAAAARDSKNKPQAILSYLLKIGFTPTKIADSFAIASGGAAFYRNRVNTYKKQGLSEKEAEAKAFEDFSLISDQTQQSGDPMLISKQQAGFAGRFILNFANTQAQMTRMQKRDFQDLINRRRIEGKNQFQSDATYLSRIGYYAAIQNVAFNALQNGIFTLLPGFDDEDEAKLSEKELEKKQKKEDDKFFRVANGMLDTTLRGAGVWTSVASVAKNTILEYNKQRQKTPFQRDNTKVLLAAMNVSPPVGSKARKFYNSLETMGYEKDVIAARGFGVMNDGRFQLSPAYQVLGGMTAATTNLPLDRVFTEINGISEALDVRNTEMQRISLALGWKDWEVGAEIEEHELIKADAKATRKIEGKKKAAATRKSNRQLLLDLEKELTIEEYKKYATKTSKMTKSEKLEYLKNNK